MRPVAPRQDEDGGGGGVFGGGSNRAAETGQDGALDILKVGGWVGRWVGGCCCCMDVGMGGHAGGQAGRWAGGVDHCS